MNIRVLKKAFGLLIVDIVIIIGIFVLQFRTDSTIIEKIGSLQVTLSQSENGTAVSLKNNLRISYNGLNVFCDDQNPAVLTTENGEKKKLVLTGWQKQEPYTFIFTFTEDVVLNVMLSSSDANASLSILAEVPLESENLSIPYNFTSNIKVTKEDSEHVVVAGKKDSWEVRAASMSPDALNLTAYESLASFALYTETTRFTFDALVDLPLADPLVFQRNIETFKNNLISSFRANSAESNVSEQVAISYISAMAERGQYAQAIDDIPQSFKRGRQKSYLSAPYFGSLDEMNVQLDNAIKDFERRISESAFSGTLDIFSVNDISSFICIHTSPNVATRLLQKAAASDMNNASVSQVTGLIKVYVELSQLNPSYAAILAPLMEDCIERITDSCSFENNVLTISENDTFLSVIQAVETGIAVLRYGNLTQNVTLQKAGYVLVNSYISEATSFDLRTLANLYPVIAYDNTYIPHFDLLRTYDNKTIYAWTCAQDITYEHDSDGSMTLSIEFPEGETHYVIFVGVPQFTRIYIYDMQYRTDPRFETYNSSGYVYRANSSTLLLKSRHKTQLEHIRFEY